MTRQTDVVVFQVSGSGYPSIQYGTDTINDQAPGEYGSLGDGNALPWTATLPYDPNALYFVVTASGSASGGYTIASAQYNNLNGGTGNAQQAESDAGC